MKIKVTPEGREGIYDVSKDEIKKFIKAKKFKQIHNIIPSGPMILGADHSVESVLGDIDRAERIAILTGAAQSNNLGHALAVIIDNRLEMFDIGKITEEQLEVTQAAGQE